MSIAIFFVVSSLLSHTAIVNLSGFGVPLFYINFAIAIFYKHRLTYEVRNLLCIGTLSFIILLAAAIFIRYDRVDTELKQLIARYLLFANFIVLYITLQGRINLTYLKIATLRFLVCAFLYGIYEFFAKLYGLPLFLSFIANSESFEVASSSRGGWLEVFRSRSFWAEPSVSSVPVLIALYILDGLRGACIGKKIEWIVYYMVVVIYSICTVSRIVLFVLILYLAMSIYYSVLKRYFTVNLTTYLVAALPMIIVLCGWPYVVTATFDDTSAIGRSSSVIVGTKIWLDNIWIGSGFNSFERIFQQYTDGLIDYHIESVVHSSVISVLQQAGISGIPLVFSPLILLFYHRLFTDRGGFSCSLCILALILTSGGMDYISSFGVLVAIILVDQKIRSNKVYKCDNN